MNIISKGGKLRLESVNDLDYVLKQIPKEIQHRKKTQDGSTPVEVALEVDGVYTRNVPFAREAPANVVEVDRIREHFIGDRKDAFALNNVTVTQSFSIHITINLVYASLAECTGEQIVKDAKERLEELQKNGFVLRAPPPEE